MKILGIESSCDETAVSIIEAEGDYGADFHFKILGNMTLSQAKLHAEFGGVYPSLAKREHAKNFVPILTNVLQESGLLVEQRSTLSETDREALRTLFTREPELFEQLVVFLETYAKPGIDALAVTAGPGLEPALWVGINAAHALADIWKLPVVAANHMEGHIAISSMQSDTFGPLSFPAIALLISGGHTEFILMRNWPFDKTQETHAYEKIGETRDDAIGEAFDKTARLLGLPYPGGPELSRLAAIGRESGRSDTYKFPRPMIGSGDLSFSFSGLKTAVRVAIQDKQLSDTDKEDAARAFEDAVTDVVVRKVRDALTQHGAKSMIIGGGVSANRYIKEKLTKLLTSEFPDTTLLVSTPERATDNALMIALAGYFHAARGDYTDPATILAEGTKQLS